MSYSIFTVLKNEFNFNLEKVKYFAGHSLGEFSALVAAKALSFESGLKLVHQRALAMQDACDEVPGAMAAVLGLEDHVIEEVCAKISGIVVAANYNCPGQLVISGEVSAINKACEKLKENGARRALVLPVGGAFHSPLMNPAKEELEKVLETMLPQAGEKTIQFMIKYSLGGMLYLWWRPANLILSYLYDDEVEEVKPIKKNYTRREILQLAFLPILK